MARPLALFYILVLYVFFQFTWWAYLLIDLNKEVYTYRIDLSEHQYEDPQSLRNQKTLLDDQLKKRWAMVLGEGAVFMSLLMFGIYRTRVAFNREFQLARQQKNFLLSITHEFKSPLAAVKLNLQTIQKRNLEPEQRNQVVRRALIETDRIHLLVENALMASRLESKNYDLYYENINFSEFTHQIVCDFIERQDHVHEFNHLITPGISIKGDKLALMSMLNNLLENAEKYSPKGTSIEVNLSRTNHESILTVRDQGIGVPDGERTKIFQKFYRIGNEDTRKTKGTGLGLFIVQHVVNLHKGKITVRANHPEGTVFEIRFPAI
ncbi:HAMP domain-containing sensor histidine kinase [soil metagenome]